MAGPVLSCHADQARRGDPVIVATPIRELRNLLVHGYLARDRRQLHSHLSQVDDFREFIQHIDAYLAGST